MTNLTEVIYTGSKWFGKITAIGNGALVMIVCVILILWGLSLSISVINDTKTTIGSGVITKVDCSSEVKQVCKTNKYCLSKSKLNCEERCENTTSHNCLISYKYTVGEKEYVNNKREITSTKMFSVDQKINVLYNPENPNESEIDNNISEAAIGTLMVTAGTIGIVGTYMFVNYVVNNNDAAASFGVYNMFNSLTKKQH